MKTDLKNQIVFICLNEEFGREVSKELADTLSMHFADCKELIEYDLFNSGEVLKQCGEEYYLKREQKVIKMICSYENSLMFVGYDIFNHNVDTFKRYATRVYLRLPEKLLSKKDVLNGIAYESRDNDLLKNVDAVVNLKKLNSKMAIKEIYKTLGALI